jgi:hypothetical protein
MNDEIAHDIAKELRLIREEIQKLTDAVKPIASLPQTSNKTESMQHLLAVYPPEPQIPKFFADVDLNAGRPCPARIEKRLTNPFF